MPSLLATTRATNLPSTGSGNVITTAAVILDSGGVNAVILPIPGSNVLKGRRFNVRVSGYAVSGTTSTLTVSAYLTKGKPSSTVASNGTAWMATSATSLASTNQNFFLEAELMWDGVSTNIYGNYHGNIANTAVALTAITSTSTTTIDLATEQGYVFSLSVLFGTTSATNNCVVTEFELEPL